MIIDRMLAGVAAIGLTGAVIGATAADAYAGTSVYIHGSAGRAGYACESIQRHKGGASPENISIQIHKVDDGVPGRHGQTMRVALRDNNPNRKQEYFAETGFFTVPNDRDQLVATGVKPGTNFSVCGQFGHANIDGDFYGHIWY